MSVADLAERVRRAMGSAARVQRLVEHAAALLDEARAGYELALVGTHDPDVSHVPGVVGEASARLKSTLGPLAAIEAVLMRYLAGIGATAEHVESTAAPARTAHVASWASRSTEDRVRIARGRVGARPDGVAAHAEWVRSDGWSTRITSGSGDAHFQVARVVIANSGLPRAGAGWRRTSR